MGIIPLILLSAGHTPKVASNSQGIRFFINSSGHYSIFGVYLWSMFHRIIKPLENNSFLLFGARGTGKTTLLKELFTGVKTLWIDLLDPVLEDQLSRNPASLAEQIEAMKGKIDWVVIDEVQKLPDLLNTVHRYIESSNIKFALTGSSARKLKRGAANLLAGRAFVNHLFPLTFIEMGDQFDEIKALVYGTLPKVVSFDNDQERQAFLRSYALTYLKEEVWSEHIVRQLEPFRKFLEVAAQCNGDIINYSNIGKDVGADTKTIQSYFEILEDTLIGFLLPPFHKSLRKQQRHSPKFYFFDTGVKRALDRTLTQELIPNTYGFGRTFEHYVIIEAFRMNDYYSKDYKFSYLRTKDSAEIDLIIERPGLPDVFAEIKSTNKVDERDVKTVSAFISDIKGARGFCLSRDPIVKKIGQIECLPWKDGLKTIFGIL